MNAGLAAAPMAPIAPPRPDAPPSSGDTNPKPGSIVQKPLPVYHPVALQILPAAFCPNPPATSGRRSTDLNQTMLYVDAEFMPWTDEEKLSFLKPMHDARAKAKKRAEKARKKPKTPPAALTPEQQKEADDVARKVAEEEAASDQRQVTSAEQRALQACRIQRIPGFQKGKGVPCPRSAPAGETNAERKKREAANASRFGCNFIQLRRIRAGTTVTVYLGRAAMLHAMGKPSSFLFRFTVEAETIVTVQETPGKVDSFGAIEVEGAADGITWLRTKLNGDGWAASMPEVSSDPLAQQRLAEAAGEISAAAMAGTHKVQSGVFTGKTGVDLPYTDPKGIARVLSLRWTGEGENVADNVNNAKLDMVLKRTHPLTYAGVIEGAMRAGLTYVLFTSAWRPMLGSWAHRHGIGLDIGLVKRGEEVVDYHWLNDETKISGEDVETARLMKEINDLEAGIVEQKKQLQPARKGQEPTLRTLADQAGAKLTLDQKAIDAANQQIKDAEGAGDRYAEASRLEADVLANPKSRRVDRNKAALVTAAAAKAQQDAPALLQTLAAQKQTQELALAEDYESNTVAAKALADAKRAIADHEKRAAELRATLRARVVEAEPDLAAEFRQALTSVPCISQTLDPWFYLGKMNMHNTMTETTHANHLHVTCRAPDEQNYVRAGAHNNDDE